MSIVYIDTETTGLDSGRHHVWEIAWAVDDGPIYHGVVPHSLVGADMAALKIGRWDEREAFVVPIVQAVQVEDEMKHALEGNTLCAANPAFDAAFLKARWGKAPWKYRLFDIEAYAMGALGYEIPQGIKRISDDLRDKGYDIPAPDHTAAADVAALRACHLALVEEYRA